MAGETIVVAQRMYQRRGTAAEWQAKNPVLQAGEIGVELTNPPKAKIGDGSTPWNSLAYLGSQQIAFRMDGTVLQYSIDGQANWINIVDLSMYGGGGGSGTVEMRVSDGYIQYRKDSSSPWVNLIASESLRGPQGIQGQAGANGLTAYQVAVQQGFAGTVEQWLASLKGDKGDKGDAGPPGAPYSRRVQVIASTPTGAVDCDWSAYDEIRVTLTSPTSFQFNGALDGQGCILKIRQDAVGGRPATLPSTVRFNQVIGDYNATQTPGRIDLVGFRYDDEDGRYDLVSLVPGIGG